jgi:hypothetical protein
MAATGSGYSGPWEKLIFDKNQTPFIRTSLDYGREQIYETLSAPPPPRTNLYEEQLILYSVLL